LAGLRRTEILKPKDSSHGRTKVPRSEDEIRRIPKSVRYTNYPLGKRMVSQLLRC
jgi:hypothetical protein